MEQIVLITGAASGIGRETAIKFANMGYSVIINCKNNVDGLSNLCDQIRSFSGQVFSYVKDVSKFEEISEIFTDLDKKNMTPDIIINNAGISYVGLLQDMSTEQWHDIIDTNLTSMFNSSKLAIPYMLKKGSGRIINISSMWGNVGASCEVAYSASKGGVNSFTKALAKELAPSGIAVNAIAFGMVDTRMNSFLTDEERAMLIDEIPAGRILSAKEAAEIIYSVATMNPYVTGQIITADGGMT